MTHKVRIWAQNSKTDEGKMYTPDKPGKFLLNLNGDVISAQETKGRFHPEYNTLPHFVAVWARIGYNNINVMLISECKDKHGKLISEGDIVYSSGNKSKYLVCFGEYNEIMDEDAHNAYGFYLQMIGSENWHECLELEEPNLTILGNKFECPELMEVK